MPEILPENWPLWWAYKTLGTAALVDGLGGVNVPGIAAGLNELGLTGPSRLVLFKKLVILARGLLPKAQEGANG